MKTWLCLAAAAVCASARGAQDLLPAAVPVPRMQAVPQPYDQVSFQRDAEEITRLHLGKGLERPFLFPVIGPAGRSVTRMGHPHDPVTHSHHNSVWIAHNDVNGVTFWPDTPAAGRIVHDKTLAFEDGPDAASATVALAWRTPAGVNLLREVRTVRVYCLPSRQWLLVIDMQLEAQQDVTLGATPFGMIGVRMAKTIGVRGGGGTIRNSDGLVDEAAVFRKPARWVDYSGAIAPDMVEGATLFDHPGNPGHPACFHVRDDGWMGASLTLRGPLAITPAAPLRLRYGLYVHGGLPSVEALDARWKNFAALPWPRPVEAAGTTAGVGTP